MSGDSGDQAERLTRAIVRLQRTLWHLEIAAVVFLTASGIQLGVTLAVGGRC